ncbi:MAG: DUF1653 domain-containing protein [Bacteroidales bacterium]|nr:DUF1653 domain-containing protein [Bacteroidales bacterium]
MPLKFYLDKRKNKYGESPIRLVWSFNGDRYQTTMGFSVPPKAWDDVAKRVTPAEYNHKNTPSTTINAFIEATEKAVNRLENYARVQNATLTKPIVKKVIADVLSAGGTYPSPKESLWMKMLSERRLNTDRYFEHFKGGRYKLIGFGKDSETLEDVVIYQALYGDNQIWVRPYTIFFSKVTLPDGTEMERFKEITL